MKKLLCCLLLVISAPVFAQQNTVTWDYQASDVTKYGLTHFSLERKAVACGTTTVNFAEVAQIPPELRTFADTAVTPGVTYCYRMSAVNPTAVSAYSNEAGRTVPFAVPVAPSGLTVQ